MIGIMSFLLQYGAKTEDCWSFAPLKSPQKKGLL